MNSDDEGSPASNDATSVFGDLTPRERRRAITRIVVRAALSVGILVGAYVLVPQNGVLEGRAVVQMFLGVILFSVVVTLQFYSIMRDPIPEVRAASALVVVGVMLTLLFALAYATMSAVSPAAFSQSLDRSSAIYFTVTVLSTVGFGDITPVTAAARWVVTLQMIVNITLVVVLGRVLLMAARIARTRQAATSAVGDGSDSSGPSN